MLTYDDCLAFMDLAPEEAAAAPGLPALVGLRPGRRVRVARSLGPIAATASDTAPVERAREAAKPTEERSHAPSRFDLAA